MYKLKYSDDNVYTGDVSDTSDIKYVNVVDFDYDFVSDKSIISDYTESTASVCFYKNQGTNIFVSGRYKEGVVDFSNETFYGCSDLDHTLNIVSGHKSSSSFFGASNILCHINGNSGLKLSFDDVYNTVNSLWIYVESDILYVKTNETVLYAYGFDDTSFSFSIYDKQLIINSKVVTTIVGSFLPYNFFIYGGINNISITAKCSMPMVFEGTGETIDDIYGDSYCITGGTSVGYLKSKADNVLTNCNAFTFDIACKMVGNSVPFSISNGAYFGVSGFVMSDACVWTCIDTTVSGFSSSILTTSGIVTISGVVSSLNDYYMIRCYYDGSEFGTIVNGEDTHISCNNATFSGAKLNIVTNDLLNIDSFAFYKDELPIREIYDTCLSKLNAAVSGTALVDSHDSAKIFFAADNFYPKDDSYDGLFNSVGEVPITATSNSFYMQYSIAGGEVFLNSDNFYAGRLPFSEAEYNCFLCENDKTFLTYFSGIVVDSNKILAESFTNYDYVNDEFITTNSGLYIRNYSKIFNEISNSVNVVEFSGIGWKEELRLGVLLGTDTIPILPNSRCVAVIGDGNLYIGTTLSSGISICDNSSIYVYLEDSVVTVSGSDTGILGVGNVTYPYSYIHYFINRNTNLKDFASVNGVYIYTKQLNVDTLTNKCFNYSLPEYYNLDNNYLELFSNVGSNISSNGIILYDYNFYDVQSSFSSYHDTSVSGIFNISGYNFLGIDDLFETGFITERWRLVCDPYGVYSCNQPGYILINHGSCGSCNEERLYDGNTSTTVHSSTGYEVTNGSYYYLYFDSDAVVLVDTIRMYITSHFIQPEDGFVIACDVDYYIDGGSWVTLLNDYISPTLSGVSWPICHDIEVPLIRCNDIRIRANSNWGQVVPTEIRPSCFRSHGGTSVCVGDNTCVHVVLDDTLGVYSEYTLESTFSVSLSGVNYYPLNTDFRFKDYAENECYIKTDWVSSSGCNITLSSASGIATSFMSCVDERIEYVFNVSRSLDIIDLTGHSTNCSGITVHSNYSFSSDDLGLGLIFYNKSLPYYYSAGSGCLFGFESDYYTIYFSSISAGYKYTALDGTDNMSKAGVGFNTYPPNLFVDKIIGDGINQSHIPCQELTASGYQLYSSLVDNNISISTDTSYVGGVQQVSKYNRISIFSDYMFMPTIFYKTYNVGDGQKYSSFSSVASLVKSGDKVYFYPGIHTVSTNKQITLVGIGSPSDIRLQINDASAGLTVMGCTTTKCAGSNVFNMYNCYILPWNSGTETDPFILLYTVVNINFYNCDLYNYNHMSYSNSYALLNKCTVYRTAFDRAYGHSITVYNEGYSTRGYYGYGPEFNRASIISGLSNVDSIKTESFYYDSIYTHFPLNGQVAIGSDGCSQLINSSDSYSVYFYGDMKKLSSFSMYLFIQDLTGTIEITNSSNFVFTVNSQILNYGIRLTMDIYGAEVDMVVPISHSDVFKLSVVAVVFDGGSFSIYLNGSKLATKYIIVVDFNDINSYLNDSIIYFDEDAFTCDGDGLLLKGASLQENIHFLVGTHVEDLYSGSTTITVDMELSDGSMLADYHDLGTSIYYGYSCRNTGVGLYSLDGSIDYKHIYFNAERSYKVYKNIIKTYIGKYYVTEDDSCVQKDFTDYVSPRKHQSITFGEARIDNKLLGHCNITEAYGYVNMSLQFPLPVIDRSSFCFDITSSVIMLSFDQESPYVRDVGINSLGCSSYHGTYNRTSSEKGIFHNCIKTGGNDHFIVYHNNLLNLTNNFTMEFLFTQLDDNGFNGYLLTKGTFSYNIAYRVGITSRHIPYFKWSWEGDNILYANKPINIDRPAYLVVVVGEDTVSFYINSRNVGVKYTDKLTIINNSSNILIGYGYPGDVTLNKQLVIEEICILDRVKTGSEIVTTWEKISGGENAPWIKINNVVVVSDKPINVSPSDRCKETNGLIDTSKWEYIAYIKPESTNGIILDSRTSKKLMSKVVSYNVIFDVSVFCEFLDYSINRDWSVSFKYKFVSGNYVSVIIDYVKYDDIYVKCEYYYNGYKNSTSRAKLILSPCGIRFVTDYNKYTYVQIGDWSYWKTLWTSTQNLFLETSGRLEVSLSNDDWDSWFILKVTDFLPRLYCDGVVNGSTLDFYDAVPYGRAFYNQIPENVSELCLSNDIFEIDASSSCLHTLEFINGKMPHQHVLDTTNRIFSNVNYDIFNIELLVYLTYDDTDILDLFPWVNIEVKDKYLYVTMRDNDRILTDSISEFLNNYIYISVSISNPGTTLRINNKKFIYDTNFTNITPYHFYPIGKNFSGRLVYFCGYHGDFDTVGYNFRVNTLSRYIGFDSSARKVFGNNIVTSIDPCSIIYSYDNPSYSSLLSSKTGCYLEYSNSTDIYTTFDKAILKASVTSSIIIRCNYLSLYEKTTSITVSGNEHNVSSNYYNSFGDLGDSKNLFSIDIIGTCYGNDSIFILEVDDSTLESILRGVVSINIKNNETSIITGIYMYLNLELSVNDVYGSSLLV